jgi:hypothetical protein
LLQRFFGLLLILKACLRVRPGVFGSATAFNLEFWNGISGKQNAPGGQREEYGCHEYVFHRGLRVLSRDQP